MKKRIKMIFVGLAIASIIGVCFRGMYSYVNMARFKGIANKISETALEKNISLSSSSSDYDAISAYSSHLSSDYFSAKDTLSKRIEKNLVNKGWALDSSDSIICGEHSIDYHGNVQGIYLLEGEEDNYRYWYEENYNWKELAFNEDGSRKREYVPQEQDYLEQVRLTVQSAIDETLTEEERNQFTDINITITSDLDFDKFIPTDYRFYTNAQKFYRNGVKRMIKVLIFYVMILAAFLINMTGKRYIAKWIFSVAAFVPMFFISKSSYSILTAIACYIVLVYFVLRILTLNHFSRTFFFAILGIILGLLFNQIFAKGYLDSYRIDFSSILFDKTLWYITVSNIFMCLMLAINNKVLLDEYIERRK